MVMGLVEAVGPLVERVVVDHPVGLVGPRANHQAGPPPLMKTMSRVLFPLYPHITYNICPAGYLPFSDIFNEPF